MFHENTELYPSGDYYDLSVGNAEPDERIILSLVVIQRLFFVSVLLLLWPPSPIL